MPNATRLALAAIALAHTAEPAQEFTVMAGHEDAGICTEPPLIPSDEFDSLDEQTAAELAAWGSSGLSDKMSSELEQHGFVIVPDLLPPKAVDALHAMSMHLLHHDLQKADAGEEATNIFRTYHLLARGRSFHQLLRHPTIQSLPKRHQRDSQLQGFSSYTVRRGANETGPWHIDGVCQHSGIRQSFRAQIYL